MTLRSSYHRGNVEIVTPGQATQEFDSFLCVHCNQIIIVRHRVGATVSELLWDGDASAVIAKERAKKRRGFCFNCMGPTCGGEACLECLPFEAKLEAQEGSRRFWKQMELPPRERRKE